MRRDCTSANSLCIKLSNLLSSLCLNFYLLILLIFKYCTGASQHVGPMLKSRGFMSIDDLDFAGLVKGGTLNPTPLCFMLTFDGGS